MGNAIYGNHGTALVDAMINLPVNDVVVIRFSGAYDRRDGYMEQNVGTVRDLDPFKKNLSGRAQALFTLSPDLTVPIRGKSFTTVRNVEGNVIVTSAAFVGGSVLVDPTTFGVRAGFRF